MWGFNGCNDDMHTMSRASDGAVRCTGCGFPLYAFLAYLLRASQAALASRAPR